LRAFLIFHACYMKPPSYLPWFEHSYNIWWSVHDMKFLIMQFSLLSCCLLSLGSI
jgi:hypothetical protein